MLVVGRVKDGITRKVVRNFFKEKRCNSCSGFYCGLAPCQKVDHVLHWGRLVWGDRLTEGTAWVLSSISAKMG